MVGGQGTAGGRTSGAKGASGRGGAKAAAGGRSAAGKTGAAKVAGRGNAAAGGRGVLAGGGAGGRDPRRDGKPSDLSLVTEDEWVDEGETTDGVVRWGRLASPWPPVRWSGRS
jgi:hypothetical protein